MASLRDTINKTTKVKSGGSLYDTTAAASGALGRAASPDSPFSSAQIGANKDQAKMAGTPAANQSVIRDSAEAQGVPSLREVIRKNEAQTGATAEEAKRKEQQGLVAGFTGGEMERRVEAIYKDKLAKAATGPAVAPTVDVATIKEKLGEGVDTVALQKDITNLFSGEASTARYDSAVAVAKALGKEPPATKEELTSWVTGVAKELQPVFGNQSNQLAQGLANAVADYESITVNDLFSETGLAANLGELAQALGLSPDELRKMNLPQFEKEIEELGYDSFAEVEDLTRRANDPYTPEAERRSILQELRRLGASGVRATEQEYAKAQEALDNNSMVTIGGQPISIREALSNTRVSEMAIGYLTGDEDFKRRFREENADFAAYLDANENALKAASNNMEASIRQIGQDSKDIASLRDMGESKDKLTDAVMNLLAPGWNKLGAKMPDKTVFDKLKQLSAPAIAVVNGQFPTLSQGAREHFLSQDPETINALIGASGSPVNPTVLKDWLEYSQGFDASIALPPEEALGNILGGDSIRALFSEPSFKLPFNHPMSRLFDANSDFKVDSPQAIEDALANLKKTNPAQAKNLIDSLRTSLVQSLSAPVAPAATAAPAMSAPAASAEGGPVVAPPIPITVDLPGLGPQKIDLSKIIIPNLGGINIGNIGAGMGGINVGFSPLSGFGGGI